jgi:DNA polymerase
MTAEQKSALASLLDTAADYLRDGYKQGRGDYAFTGGDPPERPAPPPVSRPPFPGPGADSLEAVAAGILACTACPLHATRIRAVPGEGVTRPLVMIIGEGPGADEDASGRPFVGKAGQLLDKMLTSVGLSREKNCFIANVVKCRPPGNRDPLPGETLACAPFLSRQIALLKPLVILSLGRVAARLLLNTEEGIGRLQGHFAGYRDAGTPAIPLLPTYHPSALLRDESLKRPAWEDLKTLRAKLSELDEAYGRLSGTGL